MTRPPRESPAPIDSSPIRSSAELALDKRFTAVERGVIDEILKDSTKLASYAALGATDENLSALFGVPAIAFEPFEALIRKSRADLAIRILRAHLAAAERGSAESLAFLSKEYLTARKK